MAKPKTKGDPIQVRLPLDVDASVRARALKDEATPAAVVESIVANVYRTGVQAPIVGVTTPPVTVIEDPSHTHRKKTINGAQLHVCACGAVRGVDGVWR